MAKPNDGAVSEPPKVQVELVRKPHPVSDFETISYKVTVSGTTGDEAAMLIAIQAITETLEQKYGKVFVS